MSHARPPGVAGSVTRDVDAGASADGGRGARVTPEGVDRRRGAAHAGQAELADLGGMVVRVGRVEAKPALDRVRALLAVRPSRAQSSGVSRSSSSAVVAWAARTASSAGSIGRVGIRQARPIDLLVERRQQRRGLGEQPAQPDRARQLGVLEVMDHVPDAPRFRARPPVELGRRQPLERRLERPVAGPVPGDQLHPLTVRQRRPPGRPPPGAAAPGARRIPSARGRVSAAGPPTPPGCSGSGSAWTWACSA